MDGQEQSPEALPVEAYLALAAHVSTALGIPIAIVVFMVERRRERLERERETYRTLSDRYIEYLTLLLNMPDVSTTETKWIADESPDAEVKQQLVVQIAVSLVESAYVLYADHTSRFRQAQWDGWRAYLRDWCAHPAFIEMWDAGLIDQYDTRFADCVRRVYAEVHGPDEDRLTTLAAGAD